MPSAEQWKKLVGIVKQLRIEVDDLWARVNADDSSHGEIEDETREIAERARRAVQRLDKRIKKLEEE